MLTLPPVQARELPELEESNVSGAARSLKQLPGNVGGLFSGGGALDPVVLLAQTLLFVITQLTNQLGLVNTLLNTAGQGSQTFIAVSPLSSFASLCGQGLYLC